MSDALDLPRGFDPAEWLDETEYDSKMPAYTKDESDAWQFVSESGLYELIFLSEAQMADISVAVAASLQSHRYGLSASAKSNVLITNSCL